MFIIKWQVSPIVLSISSILKPTFQDGMAQNMTFVIKETLLVKRDYLMHLVSV